MKEIKNSYSDILVFLLSIIAFLAVFRPLFKLVLIIILYFCILYVVCLIFEKAIPVRTSFTVCLALSIIIFYFFSSVTSFSDEGLINKDCTHRDHYCNLASSIIDGRVDIPQEKIQKAEWWDMSKYNNKLYMYFGITPALTFFLPVKALTGYNLHQSICLALFISIGYIFSLFLLSLLIEKSGLKSIPDLYWYLSVVCLGICPFYPFIFRRPSFYEIAIAAGICYSMGSVYWLLKAVYSEDVKHRKAILLFLSGLFCALAVGCRPHLIIITLLPLLYLFYKIGYFKSSRGNIISETAAYSIPYISYGTFLGIYNYIRFRSIFEFGVHYQMNHINMKKWGFKLSNLLSGATSYLFTPINYSTTFPYFSVSYKNLFKLMHSYINDYVVGIFWGIPVVLILVMMPSFLRQKPESSFIRRFVILMIIIGFLMLLVVSVAGPTVRYECDFAAYLLIPSLLIFFDLRNRFDGIKRHTLSFFVCLLIVYSITLNICISFTGYYNFFQKSRPELYNLFKIIF